MARYRAALPQLAPGALYLTDGGLETDLIFHHDVDLPHFAACELLRTPEGTEQLLAYYEQNASVALDVGVGFSLDTATWRANPDWTGRLGYSFEEFVEINRAAVVLAERLRDRLETSTSPMPIAGVIGPRGDGYRIEDRQTPERAADYHRAQIDVFADSAVDYLAALTLGYSEEAIGISASAKAASMPVVISFTVETDGVLPSGETLERAIRAVDDATDSYPVYYMVNCAHPTHLPAELFAGEQWAGRVRGIRANASRRSHAELDEAEELDDGDPIEFGAEFAELVERMPGLAVVGGCCGSDSRHVRAIAEAIWPERAR